MTSPLLSHQPPAPTSRYQPARDSVAEGELVRAEADYDRLREAWPDLAKGEPNEVALAMVGADMERASHWLQSLIGLRELQFTHGRSQVGEREARRFAEESAA